MLAYAISWTVWLGGWFLSGQPGSMANPGMLVSVYVGSFGPGIAAAILSRRQGRDVASQWARGFVRWGMGWRAAAIVALALPLTILALTLALGFTPKPNQAHPLPPILYYVTLFPASILNAAAGGLLGAGPLGEEGGWRGYLLPRLLAKTGALRASAIIGVIWAAWHLPIMALFPEWRDGTAFAFYLPLYTLGLVAMAYIFTTVWRLSGGSLVACIWLHGMVNALGGIAFNPKVWNNSFGADGSVVLFMASLWLLAAGLAVIQKRRTGAY
jgi:membrane protease YdiL (CAAX protease family)